MSGLTALVTGATGMVGQRVCQRAHESGYRVRALVRDPAVAEAERLKALGIELCVGDLVAPESFATALREADLVVHVAAHVGDWGPAETYRQINVVALEKMLTIVEQAGRLQRWVHISSCGVYPAGDHFGTDESAPISLQGLDGYLQTKAEAEVVLRRHMDEQRLPAVILRPGFVYGPGDRHVLPNLVQKLESGKLKFIGKGDKLLNNTYVENLVEGILLAMKHPAALGEAFNLTDARLVTRQEFIGAICEFFEKPLPGRVPEWLVRLAVKPMESVARLLGAKSPPLLTGARVKFLANNLDYSIAKAQRVLGYSPQVDFQEGIRATLEAWRKQNGKGTP